jgi:hypothetical protein
MAVKNFLFDLPEFFRKKSSDALTNSTSEFPQLDLQGLATEWKLDEIGSQDGKKNIPSPTTTTYGSNEQQIIATFKGVLTERKNQALTYIQDLERQFRNMKLSEMVSQLNNFARNAKNEFGKIIQRADDELHESKTRYENFSKKYKKFKESNNLEYEAHYPPSQLLFVGILFIEVLAETLLNFTFFKDVSENYIIGGVITAFLLSVVNVGLLGYLFGKHCFWYTNHKIKEKILFGWFSFLIFLIAVIILNYFVANYRVIALAATNGDVNFNLKEVINNMFSLQYALNLNDLFIFLIGTTAALIAFYTSYKMDDSYPGYGEIHRQLENSRLDYIDNKQDIEEELDFIQKNQTKEVANLSDSLTLNYNTSVSIIKDQESYLEKWKNAYKYLEEACVYCLRKYQENNEAERAGKKIPNYFYKKFKFDDEFIFESDVKKNKDILKKTSAYVDQIGENLTKAKSEIITNYEAARDRFKVIEQKNKLL